MSAILERVLVSFLTMKSTRADTDRAALSRHCCVRPPRDARSPRIYYYARSPPHPVRRLATSRSQQLFRETSEPPIVIWVTGTAQNGPSSRRHRRCSPGEASPTRRSWTRLSVADATYRVHYVLPRSSVNELD